MKQESKKFIAFKHKCEWFVDGLCRATSEKYKCTEKACRLKKSKYHGSYFGSTRAIFDSDEELIFWCWLKEAEARGIVSDIKFHPYFFKLSDRATIKFDQYMKTKIKTVDKFILHPHEYTPDFYFIIEHHKISDLNFFVENQPLDGKYMVVDVKGTFSQNGDGKQFAINQKWVFDKYGVYVQKIVPSKLFRKSFGPKICRLTPKTLKPAMSKEYIGLKSINELMEG